MDIRERIQQGEFMNPVPYPYSVKTLRVSDGCSKDMKRLAEYREAELQIRDHFRAALEKEYGMTDHPKALLLWTKAWDMGHSNGLRVVVMWYEDLLELVK